METRRIPESPYGVLAAAMGGFALVAALRSGEHVLSGPVPPALAVVCGLSVSLYFVAGTALAVASPTARQVAAGACCCGLVGVLLGGALGLVVPELGATLGPWGDYGADYAYLPVLFPLLGLGVLLAD